MKHFLLISIMFFATATAKAQLRTGGLTMSLQQITNLLTSHFEEDADSKNRLEQFHSHLKNRDVICTHGAPKLKNLDFSQIYLTLSLIQATQIKSDICYGTHGYLACLNDDTTKELVKNLRLDNQVKTYLKIKLNLDNEKQAEHTLDFFEKLGER